MLKKVVGAIATLSFMIGTLGMGYPHEVESQQENAYLVYSEAVTSRMSEETHSSAQTVSRVQAQGARSIARYAKEEARIQEAAMPLVMSRIEASKRKTSLTEEEIQLLQKVVSAESRGESSETQYTGRSYCSEWTVCLCREWCNLQRSYHRECCRGSK